MSHQPPFGGNWMTENVWITQNMPPKSIRNAVGFIYAGAAVQALSVILDIAAFHGSMQGFLTGGSATPLSANQLDTADTVGVGFLILGGVVGVSLWLWMASKNKAGRRWARGLSTVCFAIYTLSLLAIIARPVTALDKIIPVVEWVVGLFAIVLLWQRESSDFYAARSRRY
jgi:hypothetical protein